MTATRIDRVASTRATRITAFAAVLVLGLSLEALLFVYWTTQLKPRLERQAVSEAEILARSQANVIARALTTSTGEERERAVVRTLDELLLLRDPTTHSPFFQSVELQTDYDVVRAPRGSLDLRRGPKGGSGFRREIAIYDPDSAELLAVAQVQVSDRFYLQLLRDLQRGFWAVSAAGFVLLLAFSAILLALFSKLDRQTRERSRAENELSQQEERYQRLVDNLSAYFVFGRDEAGGLRLVSDSVNRVLGIRQEEFRSRFSAIFPPVDAAVRAERMYEVDIADAQSNVHHLEVSEVCTTTDAGAITGYEAIARDVTPQRLFQEELRHAKDLAEAANRAKSHFLANMSHEIRTPLNAITGMAALALKTDLAPKVRSYIEKIRSSTQLLVELIEDILDLSAIEAGRLEMQRVDFDLDDLVGELADIVAVRGGEKSIEILFSTAIDVPRRLRGDPFRLKQVLLNLLGNALKFTMEGEVVVDIAVVESRRERVELQFSVRDTGIGIAKSQMPSLFEPFTQADATMTRRYGGLGLGLTIARRLVGMMGGELHVESEEGKGTKFFFNVPFDVPRDAAGPRRLADEFRDLPVLVADDNASARQVLANMLRSLSCRVTTVESGEAAIEEASTAAAAGRPYRLAVLDWKMPGIDGANAAAKIAERVQWKEPLPVILVTAYDRETAMQSAGRVGIGVVLHKPVSPSSMHDAVLRVLEPSRETRSVPKQRRFVTGQQVLLVEDNAINREVARELLAMSGLAVTEAHNGLEALEALQRAVFDLVIMDVQMPELDGIETVRRMRLDPRFRDLPVIAMTAHAMLGDQERFLEAGMSDYVAKPIDEEQLFAVLARWLRTGAEAQPAVAAAPDEEGGLPDVLPGIEVAEGVRRTSGNTALYLRLMRGFRTETRDTLQRLSGLLAASARQDALDLLHTLKGAAATLGVRRTAQAAAALESTVRRGEADVSLVELSDALAEFDRSVDLLPTPRERSREPRPPVAATPETVSLLVGEIAELLSRNSLSAIDRFRDLKRAASPDDASLLRVESALERLDFDGALGHLRTFEGSLARGGLDE